MTLKKNLQQITDEVNDSVVARIENNYKTVLESITNRILQIEEHIKLKSEELLKAKTLRTEIQGAYNPSLNDTDVLKLRQRVEREGVVIRSSADVRF